MGLILNIETATTNCSVSIAKDGRIIALKEANNESYSHSEDLHHFIKVALKEASITTADLDAIAVSKGPGSYTGLRIGVSAAKGLCFALDIPLIGISTLESMASQLKLKEGIVIPVLDARRMEVYSAVFNSVYEQIRETRVEEVQPNAYDKFAQQGKVYIIGSGALKSREILKHPNFVFYESVVPSAKEMCSLSFKEFKSKNFVNTAYFEPDYLKDFIIQGSKT
ncbi:MAG: tRNA (adenosine(37)-N6)-threonylcarbamoyltransferase complex dimerization subunit type 1 TsaB [Eudoraea sp.]|nr:tRNA (adenosine(37)-N6)-threonylcarbamoyltransferase complex dimerization subunit type 1 TsaB [Eudoraea sp.]MBT8292145.1 tRNA (adenosine(37)-N6)-threonylcarbamoyltransferase complex dimerization subunit type 1 TsaB [Eudoraea sp.]